MKYIYVLAALFIMNNQLFSQDIYRFDTVKSMDIHFYHSNWDQILDSLMNLDSDSCIPARLIFEGITYDSVGIRYKGNSSYHPDNRKNPFHIELDYFKNQSIGGYKTLKLANMFKDPSFVREICGYQIARHYMPAPLCNFIYVTIDGNPHGLYTNTESVNKTFTEKHFGSKNNAFFKCDPVLINGKPQIPPQGCPGFPGLSSSLNYLNEDSTCYLPFYELKSKYGWNKLVRMIKILNSQPEKVSDFLDVDRALWMLAFNNVFVNLDSYNGSGHNYYLYEDNYGRFQPVLWDLNECFGVFRFSGITQLTINQMQTLAPDLNVFNNNRPLIQKLLNNPSCRKKYFAHYRTIFNEFVLNDSFLSIAEYFHSLIDNHVKTDPNKSYSYNDFLKALDNNFGSPPNEIVGINVLMAARKNFLINHPELKKQPPVFHAVQKFTGKQPANQEYIITSKISNADTVWLYYRCEPLAPFQSFQMFDDGKHHDGAAQDAVYGAIIPPQKAGTVVQYYVYAENQEAGAYYPEKAEYQTFMFEIEGNSPYSGILVINELLASNTKSAKDQDDEYDDWIELYNTSDTDIHLAGFYLSDNASNPFKFTLPDTAIKAGSYLIIWADEDLTQNGLHATFKLSKSGEELLFHDNQQQMIDYVQFGAQNDDVSYGRFPNGTGNFISMPPTVNACNTTFGIIMEEPASEMILQPNPAHDYLFLKPEKVTNLTGKIIIFNAMGKIVKEISLSVEIPFVIDISDLNNGLYFLKTTNNILRFVVIK